MSLAKKTDVISWTRVAHSRAMMCHLDRQVRRSGDDVVGAPVSRWLGDSAAARRTNLARSDSAGTILPNGEVRCGAIKVAVAVNIEGQGTGGATSEGFSIAIKKQPLDEEAASHQPIVLRRTRTLPGSTTTIAPSRFSSAMTARLATICLTSIVAGRSFGNRVKTTPRWPFGG
jgi:hypothetical protein